MNKIAKQDWKLVPVDPDPNFDPEKNKRIIEETIREGEKMRKRRQREHQDLVGERTSAVAQYLKDLGAGNTESTPQAYFGAKELARLRGEQIQDIIRSKIGNATKQKTLKKAKVQTIDG